MSLRISALINQKTVSFSIADVNEITKMAMYAHILESPDAIFEVAITRDYLIVTTQDSDLRNYAVASLKKQNRSTNNINAYDWKGNHIWNIAEIVGDIKAPFWGGTVTTKELITQHAEIDPAVIHDQHELYCCTATNSFLYLIDLTDKRLLQKVQTK